MMITVVFLIPARGGAQARQAPRLATPVDETVLTRLPGNTHPLARPEFDQGVVADSQPLRRIFLLLKHSRDQDSALRALMDEQQSKSSLSYHRWLTPQQFGQQFGPADADVQTVSGWLQSHGFQIARLSAGKTVIEFSGNARQVREAFHTQIHRYLVNGQEHFANSSDPEIPTALTPVVAGPVSLHNFPRNPQSHLIGAFSRSNSTRVVRPLKNPAELRNGDAQGSDFTFASSACPLNNTCNALGPADFAAIYNISPSMTGFGETIAIVGNSEICTANSPDYITNCDSDDVANFRGLFGLSPNLPNVILDGSDPGFNGNETEGDLDVEWSGAIAPNATIDFVIAQDTEANSGVDLAAQYVVDNNLAPILSESFGQCEEFLGGINQFYSQVWEQAAAQGITVVVAAGDSGSAGCDDPAIFPSASQGGLAVNGIASTPFNVAAGGTDFDITAPNYASAYWNTADASGTQASAKSYIPETTWNDSCAQNFIGLLTACNSPLLTGLNVVGGGGGESSCAIQNGFSCTAGYAKPAWQSGPYVAGMASADGVRDLPDISFFAADGFVSGSFYIVCEADLDPSDVPCSLSNPSNFTTFIGVGGTSSAAPAFAGVMALVNEKETSLTSIPTRQGNVNYVLYPLANAQKNANLNCDSTVGPDSRCTFNDITRGNNSVPCYLGTTDCNAAAPTPYGLLEPVDSSGNLFGTIAYNTGPGYDLAAGLGTVNVTNLVNNWHSVVGSFQPTTTTLNMCVDTTPPCTPSSALTIMHGQPVDFTATVTSTSGGTPSGDVTVIGAGTGPQGGIGFFTLSGGSISSQLVGLSDLPGGTYNVTAHYTGDGKFGASDSKPPISVTVSPEPSFVVISAPVLNFSNGSTTILEPSAGGFIDFGDVVYLRADVMEKATGTITFTDTTMVGLTNQTTTLGTVPLNELGYAELQMGATVFGVPLNSLPFGTHIIGANYSGDPSYSASATSSSSSLPITVLAAPITIGVQASVRNIPLSSSITVSPGTPVTLTAFIDTRNTGNPSGGSFGSSALGTELQGMVVFTVGSNALAPVSVGTGTATVDAAGFVAASVTATYTPTTEGVLAVTAAFTSSSPNYQNSSASSAASVNVENNEGFTLTPALTNATCAGGPPVGCLNIRAAGQSATSPVTVTSIGLNGTVALTCVVTPTNPADLQIPGCSFTLNGMTNSTVSLNGNSSFGTRMLNITTTAASTLAPPASLPQAPYWILAGGTFDAALCLLLLLGVRGRRPRWAPAFALLLVIIGAAAVGCGGGGGSGATSTTSGSTTGSGGSGSQTSQPGTTADIYTVTVTATPSVGTSIQTQFQVFVQ